MPIYLSVDIMQERIFYQKECDGFIPTIETLYVKGDKGDGGNDGQSEAKPLKTIGAAATRAMSGTTIYISDGVYRETFKCPSGDEKGESHSQALETKCI